MRISAAPAAAVLTLAAWGQSSVFRSESRLVEVYATVFDSRNHPVDGIGKDRFQIFEDGARQEIRSFESSSEELSCAILLDVTSSMRDALSGVRNAVSRLVDEMRPEDTAAIYAFSTTLQTMQDFTTDKSALKRAVALARAGGETALFDAIAQTAREIESRPGKKAIILFTDGADNASQLIAHDATRRVYQAGVPIFAVAEGSALSDSSLLKQLKELAEKTGGLCYRARNSHEVADVFGDIQAELKHVYLISYRPPQSSETKWRSIKVAVDGMKDYRIRGKQGYFPK